MARILLTGGTDEDCADIIAMLVVERHEWRIVDVLSAPSLVRTWRPDAIIVDVPGPDFDGAAIVTALREGEDAGRRAPILVVLPDVSFDQGLAILRSGGDLFLARPLDPRGFRARLLSLVGASGTETEAPTQGRILAFYGEKGGAGNTTVAINAAIALRRETKSRVCLIDANLQFGDHRVFLDFNLDRPGIDVVVNEGVSAESVVHNLIHHENEIDVLLAPASPEIADLVTPDHIADILAQLQTRYDYIIVDLDRRIDERTLRIFDVADSVFLVMVADLPCLKNTRLTLKILDDLNFDHSRVRLLLNRSGAFTGIKAEDVETVLGRGIDHRVVNDYRSAVSALNSGKPTIVVQPDSVLGQEFTRLAFDIAHPKPKTVKDEKKPVGLLAAVGRASIAAR